jgi:PAS domain S-box-containing protein
MAEAPHLIVYASPAWCRVCGYTAEEARGRSARMLQGALTDQDAVARFMVKVRRRHCCSMEVVNYTKGGMPFSNYLTAYPLTTDGRVTHYLSTIKPSALVTPAVAAAVGGGAVVALSVGVLSSSSSGSAAAAAAAGVMVVPSAQGGDVAGSSAAVQQQQQAAAVSTVLPLPLQQQQLLLPQHQPAALGMAALPVLTQQPLSLAAAAAAAGIGGGTAAVAGMTGFRRRKVDLSTAASSAWQ